MMMARTPEGDEKTVNRTINNSMSMIDEFRKVEHSMTANAMIAFLTIATDPGVTVSELQRRLGMNNSTIARVVASLSSHHRGGKDGFDLIMYKEDYIDRRVKHLHLTPRGQFLWKSICKALEVKI